MKQLQKLIKVLRQMPNQHALGNGLMVHFKNFPKPPVSRPVVPSYLAPQLTDRLETAIRKVMKSIDVGNKGQNNYAKIDCRPGST